MRSESSSARIRSHFFTAPSSEAGKDLHAFRDLGSKFGLTSESQSPLHSCWSQPAIFSPRPLTRSSLGTPWRSRAVLRPGKSCTSLSPSFPPKPLICLYSSVDIREGTALAGTIVCLFGLFIADASLDSSLLWEIPADISYSVSALIASLISLQTLAPMIRRMSCSELGLSAAPSATWLSLHSSLPPSEKSPLRRSLSSTKAVTSMYTSSMEARSILSENRFITLMTSKDALLYLARLAFEVPLFASTAPTLPPLVLPMVSTCTSFRFGHAVLASFMSQNLPTPFARAG
mmetsp:Transcript_9931/g.35328  ORF Transcript_9931/g.35328 Transcript_9931/m.35328 type:complete len:289 (-) Transcript_9931:240-1106(-)